MRSLSYSWSQRKCFQIFVECDVSSGLVMWSLLCWDTVTLCLTSVVFLLLIDIKVKSLRSVLLFATPWTVAYQSPPSMGFSRHECWSGLPFPSPGDLTNPGIEPGSPTLQADTLPTEPPGKPNWYWILSNIFLHILRWYSF